MSQIKKSCFSFLYFPLFIILVVLIGGCQSSNESTDSINNREAEDDNDMSSSELLSEEKGWAWVNPTPQGHGLNDVACSITLCVAVGDSGVINVSEDKQSWTSAESGTEYELNGVIWDSSHFLVVGNKGVLLKSIDGITWKKTIVDPEVRFNGITYNGVYYVLVGASYTSSFYSSADGVNWEASDNKGNYLSASSVTSSDTLFVATVYDNIFTSTDGVEWTILNLSFGKSLSSVLYANNRFVAVGSGIIISSESGTDNWTVKMSLATSLIDLTWNGSKFVAVGFDIFGWNVVTSSNGLNWSKHRNEDFGLMFLSGITSSDNTIISVGSGGLIINSDDAINWTYQTTDITYNRINAISHSNELYVAVGAQGLIVTSNDGEKWTQRNSGHKNEFHDIVWANNRFIAVGSNGLLQKSTDGVTWSSLRSYTDETLMSISWSGSIYVVTSIDSGTVLTSSSGNTWWKRDTNVDVGLWDGIWGNDEFILVGSDSTIVSSSDGINWVKRYSKDYRSLYGVAWSGLSYMAVSSYGVVVSQDGISWEEHKPSSPYSSDFFIASFIAWDGEKFLTNRFGHSYNGTDWESGSFPSVNINDIAWSDKEYVAVGEHGLIISKNK